MPCDLPDCLDAINIQHHYILLDILKKEFGSIHTLNSDCILLPCPFENTEDHGTPCFVFRI